MSKKKKSSSKKPLQNNLESLPLKKINRFKKHSANPQNKRKTLLILTALLIAIILFTALIFLKEPTTSHKRASYEKAKEATRTGDKINHALEKGDINEKEAMLLYLTTAFTPEKVPPRFIGENNTIYSDNMEEAYFWMGENWEGLDNKSKELFLPFYSPPTSAENIRNQDAREKFIQKISIIPFVSAERILNEKVILGETEARIYFPVGYLEDARIVEGALKESYDKFKGYLGIPLRKKIEVYLTTVPDAYGVTRKYEDRYIIEIDKEIGDEKKLKGTAAHELFHCFQLESGLKYNTRDKKWLMEATAVWAENYAYPSGNTEFEYLPKLFKTLDYPLISYGRDYEYGRYLWFLFMTEYAGDEDYTRKVLLSATAKKPSDIIYNDEKFGAYYGEYMKWNWNQEILHKYRDTPSFPEGKFEGKAVSPNGLSTRTKKIGKGEKGKGSYPLPPVSGSYTTFIPEKGVKKLEFKFEKTSDKKVRRYALIKDENGWHTEDWNEILKRKFCMERNKVEKIVMIVSNADSKERILSLEINAKGECPKEWHGITEYSIQTSKVDEYSFGTVTAKAEEKVKFTETLKYRNDPVEFDIQENHVDYSFDSEIHQQFDDPCGLLDEKTKDTRRLNKDYNFKDDDYPPIRISYQNGGYYISFSAGIGGNDIETHEVTTRNYKPCELEGLFTPSAKPKAREIHDGTYDRFFFSIQNVPIDYYPKKKLFLLNKTIQHKINSEKSVPVKLYARYEYS